MYSLYLYHKNLSCACQFFFRFPVSFVLKYYKNQQHCCAESPNIPLLFFAQEANVVILTMCVSSGLRHLKALQTRNVPAF